MATKDFRVAMPGGTVVVRANSAHQAAKKAEKTHGKPKTFVSTVTRRSVADQPGVKIAGSPKKAAGVGKPRTWGSSAQKAALLKAQQASARGRRIKK